MEYTITPSGRRIRKANRDFLMNLLTFIFPFLTMIAAFAIQEVYPVGDRVMLTVDSYHQYAPFLIELRNKLVSGRSLFYTWNNGLGMEYFAAFANYAASPLNIFCIFFTAKSMPLFAALVTAVRAGLASLFMSWFLTSEDKGRRDYITTAFSCAYALCGWFATDFWNLMWCDAVVLLPLVALGLKRLFSEGRYLLYIFSLGIAILSNYYTGYFLCIFMVLYAPVCWLTCYGSRKEKDPERLMGVKSFFLCVLRFAVGSILAGGISAVLLLPTYSILTSTSAVGADFPHEYELTGNLFDFLGRFFVSANPNIRDGMANVYSGVIPILMLPLFFALPKESGVRLRHKIGYGLLLLVLYVSFTNRTLNFIWHGFHFPNQIPYRESFLMSFVVITVGYMTIRSVKSLPLKEVCAVFIGAGIFIVLFEKFGSGNEGYLQILISLLFVIVEGVLIRCMMRGRKSSFFYEAALSIVMAAEMLASTLISVGLVAMKEGFPLYSSYAKNENIITEHIKDLFGKDGHKVFERTELYPNNICDIQSVYDLPGISVFSSTVRQKYVEYMQNFGFHNNGINSVRSAGLTKVTATLLGVRNLVTYEDTESIPDVFEKVGSDLEVTYFENKDALSVGYMVSDDILGYVPDKGNRDVFEKINLWVRSMGVDCDVFKKIPAELTETENYSLSSEHDLVYSMSASDTNKKGTFTFKITDADVGSDVYLYVDSGKTGSYFVTRYDDDGQEFNKPGITYRYYQTVPVGIFDGNPMSVMMSFQTPQSGPVKVYVYELSAEGYEKAVETLSREQLQVTGYDDRSIKGTISTKDGGLMLMTVSYTDGFEAYVDGVKTPVTNIHDALIGIRLEPGDHEIELYYTPHLFVEGAMISVGSVVASIVLVLVLALIRRGAGKKKEKETVVAPAEEMSEVEVTDTSAEGQSGENDEIEPES